jgi:uncharacterized protein
MAARANLHLAFPLKIEDQGPQTAEFEEYVAMLIEQVLFTAPGERVNRPQFGCGIDRLVLQPMTEQMEAATQYMIRSQLQQALAGIAEVQSVNTAMEGTVLVVTAAYTINGSTARAETTYRHTMLQRSMP